MCFLFLYIFQYYHSLHYITSLLDECSCNRLTITPIWGLSAILLSALKAIFLRAIRPCTATWQPSNTPFYSLYMYITFYTHLDTNRRQGYTHIHTLDTTTIILYKYQHHITNLPIYYYIYLFPPVIHHTDINKYSINTIITLIKYIIQYLHIYLYHTKHIFLIRFYLRFPCLCTHTIVCSLKHLHILWNYCQIKYSFS